jgi:thiamine pyrophosphokinase
MKESIQAWESADEIKRAFIFTGGDVHTDGIVEHPRGNDLRIAADSGYNNAARLGEKVDVFIGDMDSVGAVSLPKGTEVVRLKPEKDVTDTQAAVELAFDRGCREIVIIGGIGTRLDHSLSNLYILENMYLRGVHCILDNGKNRVRYTRNCELIAKSHFRYLSLIAADPIVKGVTVEGCKYPLKNERLTRDLQFAVSNEIVENCAFVSVKRGGIFIIESAD